MIRWNNDYNQTAHPAVMQALLDTQGQAYPGYGTDECCRRAADAIRAHLGGADADIHFFLGGTQVNYTMIAAALKPYEAVISADVGHIHVHESGAVENTGHKIHALPAENGKLTAAAIAAETEKFRSSPFREHITHPKMVYLSFPTEQGQLYSRQELTDIRAVCDEYGLYIYIDGARMAYGLGAKENDLTLADIARLADCFYIGGTKCGAMFGEALVLVNDDFKKDFRNHLKLNGAMLAKGWLLGLQFEALFKDDLYFKLGAGAIDAALAIRDAFRKKGVDTWLNSPTNQQFFFLPPEMAEKISKKHIGEYEETLPDGRQLIRFCTSWSTRQEDVDTLLKDIDAL